MRPSSTSEPASAASDGETPGAAVPRIENRSEKIPSPEDPSKIRLPAAPPWQRPAPQGTTPQGTAVAEPARQSHPHLQSPQRDALPSQGWVPGLPPSGPGGSRIAVIVVTAGWFATALSELPFVAMELDARRALWRPLSMGAGIAFATACAALTVGWTWLALSSRGDRRVARVAAMIAAAASALEALVLLLLLWKVPISFARWSLLALACTSLVASFAWTWRRSAPLVVLAALGVMAVIVLTAIGMIKGFGTSGWRIYLAIRILVPALLGFAALGIPRYGKRAMPDRCADRNADDPVTAHPPGLYDPEIAVVSSPSAAGPIELSRYASVMPLAYVLTVIELVVIVGLLADVVWVRIAQLAELLCLAIWAARACKNCRALGALQTRFSPRVAFLTMFFPLVQIGLGPYTFQELWRRGYGAAYTPPSRFIPAAFVVMACGAICTIPPTLLSDARAASATTIAPLYTFALLIYIAGLFMRLIAVFRIGQRQADAFGQLRVIHGLAAG